MDIVNAIGKMLLENKKLTDEEKESIKGIYYNVGIPADMLEEIIDIMLDSITDKESGKANSYVSCRGRLCVKDQCSLSYKARGVGDGGTDICDYLRQMFRSRHVQRNANNTEE